MSTSNVIVEKIDRVAVLTINRAEKRNALDQATRREFIQTLDTLRHDDAIRVVVVTGAGDKAFVAGADITEFEGRTPVDQYRVMNEPTIFDAVDRFPKPVIAMINGFALGGGCELAMACDIRIAAESAFVSTGYLRVALSGDYGIAWLLTRLVGTSRARELMFTADKVEARRAEAIGLVNRVVPDAELQQTAFALARSMAEGPTLALRYMKDNLDEALLFDFATARDHEAERLVRLTTTADHREAVQAFIDKRKAVFTGA